MENHDKYTVRYTFHHYFFSPHLTIELGQNWDTTEYVQNTVSCAELPHSEQRIGSQLNCNNLCNKMFQCFTKGRCFIFEKIATLGYTP